MFLSKKLTHCLNKKLFQKYSSSQQHKSLWQEYPSTSDEYQTINFVIEIPYLTSAKMQLEKANEFHIFQQDKRKVGENHVPRFYQQIVNFNYGYIPQTWENSRVVDEKFSIKYKGDDDPLDCVELSDIKLDSKKLYQGKVLGSLGLIDQGEVDWKILILEKNIFDKLQQSEEEILESFKPKINYIREWFRHSKSFEFKNQNTYLQEGKLFDKQTTIEIIKECQVQFQELISNQDYDDIKKKYYLK